MGRNFNLGRGRARQQFDSLRRRLYRSPEGLLLGVFRGIAESLGYKVGVTRVVGCFILLAVSSTVSDGFHILLIGFFYLLTAALMQSPRERAYSSSGGDPVYPGTHDAPGRFDGPPPLFRSAAQRPAAVPHQQAPRGPRVDLAALDRQLDSLNRRIQRMEGVVTDRQYDWDRRLES